MVGARLQRLLRRLAVSPVVTRAFMRLPRGSRLRRAVLHRAAVALGDAFNRHDLSANDYLPADVEFHPREDFPNPGVRRGGAEIKAYFEELFELFPDYRVEVVGVEEPGEGKVVFRWWSSGTGALSGVPSDALIRQTIEFRDGRVTRISESLDPAD